MVSRPSRLGLTDWAATLVTNGAILLCGLATSALAARLLQPQGRGELAIVLFWPQLAAGVGCLSLNEAIVYRVGGAALQARRTLATGFWLSLALAAAVLLATSLALPLLLGQEHQPLVPLARLYLVLFLPFSFAAMSLLAVDQGLLRLKRFNLLRLVQPTVYLTALLVLWARQPAEVAQVAIAAAAAVIVAGLLRTWLARRALSKAPSMFEARALLKQASRFHLINLATFSAAQIDKLLLIQVASKEDVGYYYVGVAFASIGMGVVTQTVQSLIFPRLSRLSDPSAIGELLARTLRLSTLLLAMLTVPLLFALPWLVPLLYGRLFAPAVAPAIVLGLAAVPRALRGIASYGLRGTGVTRPQIASEITALLIFCVLALPAYGIAGIEGLAGGLVIANMISLVPLLAFLKRQHQLELRSLWGLDRRTLREALRILRAEISALRSSG